MLQVNDIEKATAAYLDALGIGKIDDVEHHESGACNLCAKPFKDACDRRLKLSGIDIRCGLRNKQNKAYTVTVSGRRVITCHVCRTVLFNKALTEATGLVMNSWNSTEKQLEVMREKIKLEAAGYQNTIDAYPTATAEWLVARLRRRAEVEKWGLYAR